MSGRVWILGYGSLVHRESIETTLERPLGPDDGPLAATLADYRLAWNVAGPTDVRPDFVFTRDGATWSGHLGWLGLEPAPGAATPGGLWRVSEDDLTALDERELGYLRLDVTPLVDCPALPAGDRVLTYLPRPRAVANARAQAGRAVVMRRYLALLDVAFDELGAEWVAAHRAARPDPDTFVVAEVHVAPRDPTRMNPAIEPRR